MDVGGWLNALGLGRYAKAFAENDIDADAVDALTSDDLKELGVSSLGHRKKLLAAIAERRQRIAGPGRPSRPVTRPQTIKSEAERRQLTVMFVDLVGSTELSVSFDPEDLSDILRRFQSTVANEIRRYDGHIAKYMGDGVLIYFGYPTAHEDDAERAVRAGLGVTAAVNALDVPLRDNLAARVGIATGPVVVGELVGEGASQEEAVVGETPNLAARLEAVAGSGSVVISDLTRDLLGGLFELEDLGQHQLKGFGNPIRAWRVLRPLSVVSRFQAIRGEKLSRLLGREKELSILDDAWESAGHGNGRTILLSGEAGIGKSRVVQALIETIKDAPHFQLLFQCSPHHVNTALWPFADQLERTACISDDDSAAVKLDKLDDLVRQASGPVETSVPLFASMLSIPGDDRYPPLQVSPQRRMQLTRAAIQEQIKGLAERQPVLLVFEDVHWADPTSIELLKQIADMLPETRVLAVVTARPEFAPPWDIGTIATTCELRPLQSSDCKMLVREMSDKADLPSIVIEQIVGKTDGVPLYVEELTRTVLETAAPHNRNGQAAGEVNWQSVAVPNTLQDSLMARLDRLASVKDVAQIGATVGREFDHRILSAVAPLSDAPLNDALEELIDAGIVRREGTPPAATYVFKHALLRDAAYASLLRSRRTELHSQIAAALRQEIPAIVERAPEILAHHFALADEPADAAKYWYEAGSKALAQAACAEALGHFDNGLQAVDGILDGDARIEWELRIQALRGAALLMSKGHSADETGRAYARALELCEDLGRSEHLVPALYGVFAYHLLRSEYTAAVAVGERMLTFADEHHDPFARMMARRTIGPTRVYLGQFERARADIEEALQMYDEARDAPFADAYGQDHKTVILAYRALVLLQLGFPDQALEAAKLGLDHAEKIKHAFSTVYAVLFLCLVHTFTSRFEDALEESTRLSQLASRHGFQLFQPYAKGLHGYAIGGLGDATGGAAELRQCIAMLRGARVGLYLVPLLVMLARTMTRLEEAGDAELLLDEAATIADETGEHWFDAEIEVVRGDLALISFPEGTLDRTKSAESSYRKALEIARRQAGKAWQLRAAVSLAQLWRAQGKAVEARDLLSPVYGGFTEGFDTPDLKRAKAILAGL
jgi:class 3 adenylate cyclase/tetratricopeptide (TPR) repeat protein